MSPGPAPSFRRLFASHVSWYAASFAANFLTQYFCVALLWRSIDTTGQQHYAYLQVVVALVIICADFGLERSILRFFIDDSSFFRVVRSFLRRAALLSFALSLIIVVFWHLKFGHARAAAAACFMGCATAFFSIAGAFHRSTGHVDSFVAWNTLRNVGIGAAVALLYFVAHCLSLTSWYLAHGASSLVVGSVIYLRFARGATALPQGRQAAAPYAGFIMTVFLSGLILWLQGFIDVAILGRLYPGQLPDFRRILDYAFYLGAITILINRAWPTLFFTVSQHPQPPAAFTRKYFFGFFASIGATAIMLCLAPWGIELLSGKSVPAVLYPAIAVILAGDAAGLLFAILRPYYELKKANRFMFTVFTAAVCTNALLNMALIPPYKILGAAVASLVSSLVIVGCFLLRVDVPSGRGRFLAVNAVMLTGFYAILAGLTALMMSVR